MTAVAVALLAAAAHAAEPPRDLLPQKFRFVDQLIERARALGGSLDEPLRLRGQAEEAVKAGKGPEADQLLSAALRHLAQNNLSAGPNGAVVQAESRRRVGELMEGVGVYREALGEAVRLKGAALASVVDMPKVEALVAQARTLADAGKPRDALGPLVEAHGKLEAAVVRLRSNDTVTYSRVFRTPQDELRFETARFEGNRELIARALDSGLAAPQRARLIAARDDAARLADAAQALAKAGDVKAAIRSVEQANGKILDVVMALSRE
ncbi:hypothetical protein [Azospirillum sp.]|uniref:hypothetical protein n=1 Tax=Azospirillum sp. TaxID=34012 RepID=UPI003D75B9B6